MSKLSELVFNFPTKNKEGYTSNDIKNFLSRYYPSITTKMFYDKLGVRTASLIGNEVVDNHADVELAIRCILEDRNFKSFEFD